MQSWLRLPIGIYAFTQKSAACSLLKKYGWNHPKKHPVNEAGMTSSSKKQVDEFQDIFATLNNVEIIAAPHLKPNIKRLIRNGDYEQQEIEIGLANLQSGDRIMEMGTGAGIVGSVFAKNIQNLTVRSFEANPDLIPHIRNLYNHNGVDNVVTVTNNVVVSGNDAPDSMDFEVRDNFLGSRLSHDGTESDARTVSIPTQHYDDITREYPHNVLVMDIEGGELDFLADADLSGVELVMLELHPKVYGGPGRAQVVGHLERQGFKFDETTSIGDVVTFKKPQRMKIKPDYSKIGNGKEPQLTYDLDPNEPLAGDIITVKNAVLAKTPRSQGWRIAATVFDEDRYAVPEAVCWISRQQTATKARTYPRENRIKELPGTWLYGGRFFPHFGHFLIESLSRIWALDHINEPIEGVIFFPTYNDREEDAEQYFENLSKILDKPIKYKICDEFYRVDKLIIPPQGAGVGRLLPSAPEMRDFMTTHLKRDVESTGHDKIYISRSGQFGKVGRSFLGERHLEELLVIEGYTIFHPQDHSWEEQMRHYLCATHVLGPDGSPFHMVNFTGRDDLSVGVIQRRPGPDVTQMVGQSHAYGIEKAFGFPHLGRSWSSAGDRRAAHAMVSEVKFSALCTDLKERGFIGKKAKWKDLSEAKVKKALLDHSKASKADQRLVYSQHESLAHFPPCVVEGKPQVFLTD
jgi:FkbM family methyltransferase